MNVHRRWIYASAGLLAINVLAMAVLVTASSHSAPLVVPQYYERAVAWDQAMADARRAAALGWRLELALGDGGALELSVRTADGQPVAGVHVVGGGVHRGSPRHRLAFDLTTDADGRAQIAAAQAARQEGAARPATKVLPGWYQLELTVERGAVRYSERRAARLRDPAGVAAPAAAAATTAAEATAAASTATPGAQP